MVCVAFAHGYQQSSRHTDGRDIPNKVFRDESSKQPSKHHESSCTTNRRVCGAAANNPSNDSRSARSNIKPSVVTSRVHTDVPHTRTLRRATHSSTPIGDEDAQPSEGRPETHTQHSSNAARPATLPAEDSALIHTTQGDIRPSDKQHTFRVASPTGLCSPEQIRTAVTALRGRRPRPLDDGAKQRFQHESVGQIGVQPPLQPARGGGLEPPITGSEPVVLPITPPPNGCAAYPKARRPEQG